MLTSFLSDGVVHDSGLSSRMRTMRCANFGIYAIFSSIPKLLKFLFLEKALDTTRLHAKHMPHHAKHCLLQYMQLSTYSVQSTSYSTYASQVSYLLSSNRSQMKRAKAHLSSVQTLIHLCMSSSKSPSLNMKLRKPLRTATPSLCGPAVQYKT